jgi:predicted GNAT family N-acyltransferase
LGLEHDGQEGECTHFLLYDGPKAIATARLRPTGEGNKVERMAVLEGARGKNAGRNLMQFIIKEHQGDKEKLYLHAQEQVRGFYAKLGFAVASPRFLEAGIGHYKMELKREQKNESTNKTSKRTEL